MRSDVAISVKNLTKTYRIFSHPGDRIKQALTLGRMSFCHEFTALQDVSFEIKKGEAVGIIGRNGSGKSTLLQLICGILKPTSGEVQVNGRISALLELGSGFNPEFTGLENVYFQGVIVGLSRSQMNDRLDDIIAFADIGEFINQPVRTYSSGMFVRLAFAVIAHIGADILVVDEALSVGDAFFVQKCMRFLHKFMENGTVLFVSHDTSVVTTFCQRAICLNGGILKYLGAPKEVAQKYLAELYESQQGESSVLLSSEQSDDSLPVEQPRDMRLDFINSTIHRNDIELFNFEPDADSFGKGGGSIISVQLLDQTDRPLAWIVGGECVKLRITCRANKAMFSPIIGFFVNDRLGQPIFGENTFNFSEQSPLSVAKENVLKADFEFCMPILPVGDYSITVALAEGTQHNHVQHHWLHEALLLKSHSSSVSTGLVGVPMRNITLSVK